MSSNNKIVFLPGLNGIRTLAACGVMVGHITGAIGKLSFSRSLFGFNKDGVRGYLLSEHGVTMFFVLSGFLITYLMLLKNKNMVLSKRKNFICGVRFAFGLYIIYILLFAY